MGRGAAPRRPLRALEPPLRAARALAVCAAAALEAAQLVVRALRPAWLNSFHPRVPETWTPAAAHGLQLGLAVGALFGGAQWLALRGRLPGTGW